DKPKEYSKETVEKDVLQSWIVAWLCKPDYLIARSVLVSSVGVAVTLCVLCYAAEWMTQDYQAAMADVCDRRCGVGVISGGLVNLSTKDFARSFSPFLCSSSGYDGSFEERGYAFLSRGDGRADSGGYASSNNAPFKVFRYVRGRGSALVGHYFLAVAKNGGCLIPKPIVSFA
ncbi:hypothetical protein KI387_006801, partial [Taxus chinensis]